MVATPAAARADRAYRAVFAGFLATLLASVVLIGAYILASAVAPAIGGGLGRWLLALTQNPVTSLVQGALARAMLVNLAIGLVWAEVYAYFVEPRLVGPGWRRGGVFALVPWLLSLVIFLPLVGAGMFGLAIGAGPLPIVGNLIIHLVYGGSLGAIYALETAERGALDGRDRESLLTNIAAERGLAAGLLVCGVAGAIIAVIGAAIADGTSTAVWSAALAGAAFGAAAGAFIGSFVGLSRQSAAPMETISPVPQTRRAG